MDAPVDVNLEVTPNVTNTDVLPVSTVVSKSKKRSNNKSCYIFGKSSRHSKGKCPICNKMFRRDYLKEHLMYTHGPKEYQCSICNKCFQRPKYAESHITQVHVISAEEAKNYVVSVEKSVQVTTGIVSTQLKCNCYDCDESFSSIAALFEHCNTHRFDENGRKYPYLVPPKECIKAKTTQLAKSIVT